MPSQPTNSVTRQLSQRSVFEALLHRSPISRADLAKVTGLSKQRPPEVIDAFEQQVDVEQRQAALERYVQRYADRLAHAGQRLELLGL